MAPQGTVRHDQGWRRSGRDPEPVGRGGGRRGWGRPGALTARCCTGRSGRGRGPAGLTLGTRGLRTVRRADGSAPQGQGMPVAGNMESPDPALSC